MPRIKTVKDMPDVQECASGFPNKRIKKVGIRNVNVPLKILRKDGTVNTSSGNISIYTDLNEKVKGSNMSRYRILIEENLIGKDLNLRELLRELLHSTKEKLKSENSYIKIKFDYFLIKNAPVSKIKSHMDYRCILEGKLIGLEEKYFLTVIVPYTSCCPFSKSISDYGSHNQRSFANVKVQILNGQLMWIEDIIDIVENCASSPIINILKRPDESYQTELMYERPMFVEDMVRHIGEKLDSLLDKTISDYAVISEHQESIHTSDAVAVLTAGRNMQ